MKDNYENVKAFQTKIVNMKNSNLRTVLFINGYLDGNCRTSWSYDKFISSVKRQIQKHAVNESSATLALKDLDIYELEEKELMVIEVLRLLDQGREVKIHYEKSGWLPIDRTVAETLFKLPSDIKLKVKA